MNLADTPAAPAVGDDRPIGVFDSGTGGLSVLRALRAALPREDFFYCDDSGFGPYGERDEAFVVARTRANTEVLRRHGIKALVIACNTATAAAVEAVRALHPDLPVVGVEPALKPALSASRTGRVGVIATRGTLASGRFQKLQAAVGGHVQWVLQPCDGLAAAIDASAQNGDDGPVRALCERYLRQMGGFGVGPGEIDTLVLGCTHYVLVSAQLQALLGPWVQLLDNGEAIARQTVRRLGSGGLASRAEPGRLSLLSSGDAGQLDRAVRHWLRGTRPLAGAGLVQA